MAEETSATVDESKSDTCKDRDSYKTDVIKQTNNGLSTDLSNNNDAGIPNKNTRNREKDLSESDDCSPKKMTNPSKRSRISDLQSTSEGLRRDTSSNKPKILIDGDNVSDTKHFTRFCSNPDGCITLKEILKSFNAPISEEQGWALIHQATRLYRDACQRPDFNSKDLRAIEEIENLNVHNDGSVHINCSKGRGDDRANPTQRKILMKIGLVVFFAMDYNLQADEDCLISPELEQLIAHMTAEDADDDCIDEGIDECDKRWEDEPEEEKTKEFDYVLEACTSRCKPSVPEDHYRAVCRALVTEALELRIFLQKVFEGDTESLRLKADTQTSKQELDKLGFNDWARFWMQVVDELRRGVRLKKCDFSRTPVEYTMTPYEILMEDIRSRKYNLRKVMVNGDIPPRVKKDAHALILEFIRSRPPLKKASERKLPPPIKRTPSPREQLMDSIRKGQRLKPIHPEPARLKNRLLPPTSQQVEAIKNEGKSEAQQSSSPRSKQRLIKVDFSLLKDDDDDFYDDLLASGSTSIASNNSSTSFVSQTKMPPYPISGYNNENNPNKINTVLRRTTYDLATQCESRRASMRRHTIVGCQSNFSETNSMPTSRPESRQSETIPNVETMPMAEKVKSQHPHHHQTHNNLNAGGGGGGGESTSTSSNLTSMETFSKNSLDEKQWSERITDRLSLTLEEIVHIRSVMTKAELESLPVGVRVKEDVERRKVCFLCLRTRFSFLGSWGVQCKLCQRTVCSKCYSKMRIPTEHFRNVPVVLLSPSLMASPAGSSTPSPSHHSYLNSSASILDENFPKSLMERLLRSESDRKARNSVGSAPSSPKHQRSNISTPGNSSSQNEPSTSAQMVKSMIATSSTVAGTSSSCYLNGCNKENNNNSKMNLTMNGSATNRDVANIMSRSMEGPRSLPVHSPARTHSNSSTLDRKSKFSRAFTLSSSGHLADQKENLRGELMAVCNDCRGLVLEIIRSSKQTRSSARNRALKNLTLDLSPVYKR